MSYKEERLTVAEITPSDAACPPVWQDTVGPQTFPKLWVALKENSLNCRPYYGCITNHMGSDHGNLI